MVRICWLKFVWKMFWSEESCPLSDFSPSPCEMIVFLSTLLLSTMPEGETSKISAEIADWVFLNAICVCIHSPQQRVRMGTPGLWMCKGMTVSTARGGLGYKVPFAGLNSRLNEDPLCFSAMAATLASSKLSCRQMWTFPEATFGCSECFRGKAVK